LSFPASWFSTDPTHRYESAWAYAAGHGVGAARVDLQSLGAEPGEPQEIELPAAQDVSFLVLLPDGKPAVGAKVTPLHFKTWQGYALMPKDLAKLVGGVANMEGRVAMPALTREGLFTIDVELDGCGTQRFNCRQPVTDLPEQTLQLRPVGAIEGRIVVDQIELARDAIVSIETESAGPDGWRLATGIAMVKVDEAGKFVIPQIAEGRVQLMAMCDRRLPVRPRLPAAGKSMLLAGETHVIDIPLEMAVRVQGVVREKEMQRPVAGAVVSVSYGELRQSDQVMTDDKGEFSALALAGEAYVQLISIPRGFVQTGEPWNERRTIPADVESYQWPAIEVEATIKLSGKVIDSDGKPLGKVRINGVVGGRRYGFGDANDRGEFSLDGVPKDIPLESFQVWLGDEQHVGEIESREPLVLRVAIRGR
jgi:hypothetical protein